MKFIYFNPEGGCIIIAFEITLNQPLWGDNIKFDLNRKETHFKSNYLNNYLLKFILDSCGDFSFLNQKTQLKIEYL